MRPPIRLPSPARAWRSRAFPLRAPTIPAGVEPLQAPTRTGAAFDTEWARRWPARLARAAIVEGPMRAAVRIVASPSRVGADRLDSVEGPVIFAANHHSHVDTPLMLTSIPPRWRHKTVVGAAADYFFRTRAGGTASALAISGIPIERARVGRRSADLAASLIDMGWSLLIYPEGGRSPDGWGQPFRGGAAYLALRCGVAVVPVHVGGTGGILRKGHHLPRRARATVTFGAPLLPVEGERATAFAARLERAVAALADEIRTDWYSARRRAHAGATDSLNGPETGAWRRHWTLTRPRSPDSDARARSWPDL